jgi:hypothetical protein
MRWRPCHAHTGRASDPFEADSPEALRDALLACWTGEQAANAISSATQSRWQRRPGASPRNPCRTNPLRIPSPFGISCAKGGKCQQQEQAVSAGGPRREGLAAR